MARRTITGTIPKADGTPLANTIIRFTPVRPITADGADDADQFLPITSDRALIPLVPVEVETTSAGIVEVNLYPVTDSAEPFLYKVDWQEEIGTGIYRDHRIFICPLDTDGQNLFDIRITGTGDNGVGQWPTGAFGVRALDFVNDYFNGAVIATADGRFRYVDASTGVALTAEQIRDRLASLSPPNRLNVQFIAGAISITELTELSNRLDDANAAQDIIINQKEDRTTAQQAHAALAASIAANTTLLNNIVSTIDSATGGTTWRTQLTGGQIIALIDAILGSGWQTGGGGMGGTDGVISGFTGTVSGTDLEWTVTRTQGLPNLTGTIELSELISDIEDFAKTSSTARVPPSKIGAGTIADGRHLIGVESGGIVTPTWTRETAFLHHGYGTDAPADDSSLQTGAFYFQFDENDAASDIVLWYRNSSTTWVEVYTIPRGAGQGSHTLIGTNVPANDIGQNGDGYLRFFGGTPATSLSAYLKASGVWVLQYTMTGGGGGGGSTLHLSSAEPLQATGADGDTYMRFYDGANDENRARLGVYTKNAGAWTLQYTLRAALQWAETGDTTQIPETKMGGERTGDYDLLVCDDEATGQWVGLSTILGSAATHTTIRNVVAGMFTWSNQFSYNGTNRRMSLDRVNANIIGDSPDQHDILLAPGTATDRPIWTAPAAVVTQMLEAIQDAVAAMFTHQSEFTYDDNAGQIDTQFPSGGDLESGLMRVLHETGLSANRSGSATSYDFTIPGALLGEPIVIHALYNITTVGAANGSVGNIWLSTSDSAHIRRDLLGEFRGRNVTIGTENIETNNIGGARPEIQQAGRHGVDGAEYISYGSGDRSLHLYIPVTASADADVRFDLSLYISRYSGEASGGGEGTTVVANPGGSGLGNLNTIRIGTTSYDVAGDYDELTDKPITRVGHISSVTPSAANLGHRFQANDGREYIVTRITVAGVDRVVEMEAYPTASDGYQGAVNSRPAAAPVAGDAGKWWLVRDNVDQGTAPFVMVDASLQYVSIAHVPDAGYNFVHPHGHDFYSSEAEAIADTRLDAMSAVIYSTSGNFTWNLRRVDAATFVAGSLTHDEYVIVNTDVPFDLVPRLSRVEADLGGLTLWSGTQDEYNAIATKDDNTLYAVTA